MVIKYCITVLHPLLYNLFEIFIFCKKYRKYRKYQKYHDICDIFDRYFRKYDIFQPCKCDLREKMLCLKTKIDRCSVYHQMCSCSPLLWNAVLLFNPEFAICVIWIVDMYISRIDFVISWIQFVISQIEFMISRIKFVISRKLISDMYISRIGYVQIRDMYISRIQITHREFRIK